MNGLRDYGYGESTRYVKGPPRIVDNHGPECPHCHCTQTYMIEVAIESHPVIGDGMGVYVGCACCPWASKMVMVNARSKAMHEELFRKVTP